MSDSEHAWLVVIFLILLDVILYYALPYLTFIDSFALSLILLIIGIGNIFGFAWVMT